MGIDLMSHAVGVQSSKFRSCVSPLSLPNKTFHSDPAPTWLDVKEMRGLLSPFICLLFNKSFTTGCFPEEFKEAVVRRLSKKNGLDAMVS